MESFQVFNGIPDFYVFDSLKGFRHGLYRWYQIIAWVSSSESFKGGKLRIFDIFVFMGNSQENDSK